MFNGINKVILVGYLGSNPEVVTFSNKKYFVKVNLATTSSWKDNQTQEWIKRIEWHQIIFYNKWSLLAEKYLKKGSKIYIEGSLKTDKFEKNGTFVFSTKIICNNLLLLNNKESFKEIDEIPNLQFNNEELYDINKNEEKEEEEIPF